MWLKKCVGYIERTYAHVAEISGTRRKTWSHGIPAVCKTWVNTQKWYVFHVKNQRWCSCLHLWRSNTTSKWGTFKLGKHLRHPQHNVQLLTCREICGKCNQTQDCVDTIQNSQAWCLCILSWSNKQHGLKCKPHTSKYLNRESGLATKCGGGGTFMPPPNFSSLWAMKELDSSKYDNSWTFQEKYSDSNLMFKLRYFKKTPLFLTYRPLL